MAVVIRMKRTGRRLRPSYRISVLDKRWPRDGKTLDTLGNYDPIAPKEELEVRLDVERARAWLDRGAVASETVNSIFRRQGVYEGRPVKPARTREGRAKETAKRERRNAAKAGRAERKSERREARVAAAAAAASEAAASEESAE